MGNKKKVSLAACSGMSPHGLITRVACSDIVEDSDNTISICMGATSADKGGFRKLIHKYPIIAVNGCKEACVNRILEGRGVNVSKSLNIMELTAENNLNPQNVSRLDEEGENCVKIVKKRIEQILAEY